MTINIIYINIKDKVDMRKILNPIFILIFGLGCLSCNHGSSKTDANDSVITDSNKAEANDSAIMADTVQIQEEKNEINPDDLALLNKTIGNIYYKIVDESGNDGSVYDSDMKRIKKFGTDSLINAAQQNYDYARKRVTTNEPYIGGNPFVADLCDCGTDGSVECKYKGFTLGEVVKNGNIVEANVKLKFNFYDYLDDSEKPEISKKNIALKLRFEFSDQNGEKVCKLDDIMFVTKMQDVEVPDNKWLKKEMESNRLFKPVFRP